MTRDETIQDHEYQRRKIELFLDATEHHHQAHVFCARFRGHALVMNVRVDDLGDPGRRPRLFVVMRACDFVGLSTAPSIQDLEKFLDDWSAQQERIAGGCPFVYTIKPARPVGRLVLR